MPIKPWLECIYIKAVGPNVAAAMREFSEHLEKCSQVVLEMARRVVDHVAVEEGCSASAFSSKGSGGEGGIRTPDTAFDRITV